jgi:DNA-binding NtrC family response regulator
MTTRYMILCVDDEREVLDSVIQDLDIFEDQFILEGAQSVSEAREVIADNQDNDIKLALILCDHIMPEQTGVSFLIELSQHNDTKLAKKLLLTGQAGLDDTVEAINHDCLDFYISKPWNGEQLRTTIKDQLTKFIIDNETDVLPWMKTLDPEKLLATASKRRLSFGE